MGYCPKRNHGGYIGEKCPKCAAGPSVSQGPIVQPARVPVAPRAAAVPVPPIPRVAQPPAPAHAPLPAQQIGISWKKAGQQALTPLAANSVVYVRKGFYVEFHATAAGAGPVQLSKASWTGTAPGAIGGGQVRSLRFTENSQTKDRASGKTLALSLMGQSVSVTIIVYEIKPDPVIEDDFAGRSQTDLGVDERVMLRFKTEPQGIGALELGGLRWGFKNAVPNRDTVGLLCDPSNGLLLAPDDQSGVAKYVAPCRTSPSGTKPPAATKDVTLTLSISNGIFSGPVLNLSYKIHHPTGHMRIEKPGKYKHIQGQASAGFLGVPILLPKKVSFKTLRFREGNGMSIVSGELVDLGFGTSDHATSGEDGSYYTRGVSKGNSSVGSLVWMEDRVYSGGVAYAPPAVVNPNRQVGQATWPINWEYTYPNLIKNGQSLALSGLAETPPAIVGVNHEWEVDNTANKWANDWIFLSVARHIATLYENGKMKMYKGCGEASCDVCKDTHKEFDMADAEVSGW